MNIKHLQGPYKHVFLNDEEIQTELALMEDNASFNTKPSYMKDTSSSIRLVTFLERHAAYLKGHPKVNPEHYLSNLRTVIRIRP